MEQVSPTGPPPTVTLADPIPSSEHVRARFQRQRTRDTEPEIALRKALHALGLRYRLDHPTLVGSRRRADIVFRRQRIAVYVDGCFWHGCPEHSQPPKANAQWWAAKISRNRARDRDTDAALIEAGWTVIRVWEHEPVDEAAARIDSAVQDTPSPTA